MTHTVVVLKRGKTKPILSGHPWIFSGAIQRIEAPGSTPVVEVHDEQGTSLGFGFYSSHSDIRVRMASALSGAALDVDSLYHALERASARRATLGLGTHTNVYRWCNSEGDGLPGVTVDRINDVAVMQLNTWCAAEHADMIADALMRFASINAVVRAPAPSAIVKKENLKDGQGWVRGEARKETIARESGIQFVIEWQNFQKTGHYADMREHREWIGSVSAGKTVLDAYAYTGGFGLHAAQGGAEHVMCVDSSAPAVSRIVQNAELNGYSVATAISKVDDFLRSASDRNQAFDIIVLDPPKLAPSRKHVAKALKVYESLAVQAARILSPGGILALGSCSEAIGQTELQRVFGAVRARTSRSMAIVRSGIQSCDHPYPAAMREGQYLTFVAAIAD